MSRVVLSPEARGDLRQILEYIGGDNPRAATTIVGDLRKACSRLADWPQLGTTCDEISIGLRYFTRRSYVIYYRPTQAGIEVVRVVHGARDQTTLF